MNIPRYRLVPATELDAEPARRFFTFEQVEQTDGALLRITGRAIQEG